MNLELESKLVKKYPKSFRDIYSDPKKSCMAFGCDHGDGWYSILNAAFSSLKDKYDRYITDMDTSNSTLIKYHIPHVVAKQIKEKYGRLVIYWDLSFPRAFTRLCKKYPKTMDKIITEFYGYIDGVIRMAEQVSVVTCEECGNPGSLCTTSGDYRGWHKTLCPICEKKYNYKKLKKS